MIIPRKRRVFGIDGDEHRWRLLVEIIARVVNELEFVEDRVRR